MSKIIIKATNLSLTSAIKQYTEEKIGGLEKFLDNILLIRVELEMIPRRGGKEFFRAEAMVDVPRQVFRAESKTENLYSAIDILIPKITSQVEKYKNRRLTKIKKMRRKIKEGKF